MPTAAVSQEPVSHDDVEAAVATTNGQGDEPVEIEAEQGQEDAGRVSATLLFLNGRRRMSDFPFFALGFAAVVSAQQCFRIWNGTVGYIDDRWYFLDWTA